MNASNTLTVAAPLTKIAGMQIIPSKGTSGNSRLSLMSKRDFVAAWLLKAENRGKAKKQAARDFVDYRVATLKDFNAQLAVQIANGNIQAERINADKNGDLRTIALSKRDRKEQDQSMESIRRTSELTGIPVDELIKRAKERHTIAANATIDVQGSEQPATTSEQPAAPEQPTTEPTNTDQQVNAPQAVETAT